MTSFRDSETQSALTKTKIGGRLGGDQVYGDISEIEMKNSKAHQK